LGHDDPVHALDTAYGGSGVGAVEHADGTVALLGSLVPDAWVAPSGDKLVGTSEGHDAEWFTASGAEVEVFDAYAAAVAASLGRRGGRRMRVWCSWYSMFEDVTETEIDIVLNEMDDLPFDVIQVDDGWQRGIGDWTANATFPSGMDTLAERIESTGRRAGLWLAPLIARSDSDLARLRPELLLRDHSGDPVVSGINWGGPYFSLDPTSNATLEYLNELADTVTGWGYSYLKLDFLYGGAYPGRHRVSMPREMAYREAMAAMRKAAGDNTYLLACGAPVLASVGVFDGIRVGPDVADFWEEPRLAALNDESGRGVRNALATATQRLWWKAAIDVDPDIVYFASSRHSLEPRATAALRDVAHIAEFIGISDRPAALTQSERRQLTAYLAANPESKQVGRQRWQLDGREVDFSWVLDPGLTSLFGLRGQT
jgi:alpha-galactosidase